MIAYLLIAASVPGYQIPPINAKKPRISRSKPMIEVLRFLLILATGRVNSRLKRKNDRTTICWVRQDHRGLDALGTSGVEGSADAG